MDKRLSQRFEKYITNFKDQISAEIKRLNAFNDDSEKLHEFLNFVYEYERMEITHSDFLKRKRVKNTIPDRNRCNACKAGGEQCTRRRRENSLYCGTHLKGAPHGEITECPRVIDKKQLEIVAKEVNGVIYYIDSYNNVYKMEDVLAEKENPDVIGEYTEVDNVIQIILK